MVHEASQKAAGVIPLCLTLSEARNGKARGIYTEFARHICSVRVDPNLPVLWGVAEHGGLSLGYHIACAWSALSFRVLRRSVLSSGPSGIIF